LLAETEEENNRAKGPKKREDEAEPKEPLGGGDPRGPLVGSGGGFVVDGIAKGPLMYGSTGSVGGSRVLDGGCGGGSAGSNEDTVEGASTGKARGDGKIECGGFVGGVCLGLDEGREIVESKSTLGVGGMEIDVLEIDGASVAGKSGGNGRFGRGTAGIGGIGISVPHVAKMAPICVVVAGPKAVVGVGEAWWVFRVV